MVHLTLVAATWAEWKALLSRSGHIEDEYGRRVILADFVEVVEGATHPTSLFAGKPLLNHVLEIRKNLIYAGDSDFVDESKYWLDDKGYSFSIGEFS